MPGELNKVRDKSYSKGKEKGFWKMFIPKKNLHTREDPHNNHTIEDQGCSWTTPLKNCLGAMCYWGFNKASYILGNETF